MRVATTSSPPLGVLRVSLPQRIRAGCDNLIAAPRGLAGLFATAHSCGLRHSRKQSTAVSKPFATAHSCGLRRYLVLRTGQILSLPQRIRAGCDRKDYIYYGTYGSLPQRIRAGCDIDDVKLGAWKHLCHSAFVRVATIFYVINIIMCFFATAHSCGLRLRKSNAAHCEFAARR